MLFLHIALYYPGNRGSALMAFLWGVLADSTYAINTAQKVAAWQCDRISLFLQTDLKKNDLSMNGATIDLILEETTDTASTSLWWRKGKKSCMESRANVATKGLLAIALRQ